MLDKETQVHNSPEAGKQNYNNITLSATKEQTDSRQKWGCLWQPWLALGGYFKSPFTQLRAMFRPRSKVRRGPRYHLQGDDGTDHGPALGPADDAGAPLAPISASHVGDSTSGKTTKEGNGIGGSSKRSRPTAPNPARKRRVRFAEPLPSLSGNGNVRERRRYLRSQLRNYRKESKRGRHPEKMELCILIRHP